MDAPVNSSAVYSDNDNDELMHMMMMMATMILQLLIGLCPQYPRRHSTSLHSTLLHSTPLHSGCMSSQRLVPLRRRGDSLWRLDCDDLGPRSGRITAGGRARGTVGEPSATYHFHSPGVSTCPFCFFR